MIIEGEFTIIQCEQGTDEWKKARAGRATGSRAKDMLSEIKSGEAAGRRDYRFELLCERLTGEPSGDFFVSKEMQWGTDQEPYARMAYEMRTGHIVRETGFLQHNKLMAGVSLDGDIDNFTGIVEFKCPKTATHIGYIQDDRVPLTYIPQITFEMWLSGAQWCDFVSYDPRLPDYLQLFVKRITRAELPIAAFEMALRKFLGELDKLETQMRLLDPKIGAAS